MPDQVTERGLRDPRLREGPVARGRHAPFGSPMLLSAEVSEDAPQTSVRSVAAGAGSEPTKATSGFEPLYEALQASA